MASVVIGALLVALAATNALAQSCAEGGGTSKISFSNGDFEDQGDLATMRSECGSTPLCSKSNFRQMSPAGWTTTGYTYVAQNGNAKWGRLNSKQGNVYMIIQLYNGGGAPASGPTSISQKVTGMKANGTYMLSFLAAERLGAGLDERLDVIVNGKTLLAKHNPATFFKQVRVVFNADSSGEAEVKILNTSPGLKGGDHSVMVDDFNVKFLRDCGKGATCHDNDHYVYGTGYSCICDAEGFVGHTVRNGKADCEDITSGTPGDNAIKVITQLKEQIKDMEEATDKLVRKQGALVTEVGVLQRDAAVKDELMANVTAKMDTDHQAAIKAVKDSLQLQIDAAKKAAADANYASKIQAIQATVNGIVEKRNTMQSKLNSGAIKLTVPESNPTGQSTPPQIVSDVDALDVQLREGLHLTVNGKDLLTAEETVTMINNLLQNIADQL